MPIAFRCTRCRSRLHVPQRWQGTSVACPKCSTRVMVPAASDAGPTGFEQRDVEKSLDALHAAPGGIFSADTFELPEAAAANTRAGGTPPGDLPGGVTLPRWAIYASMASYLVVAGVGFALGWVAATGGGWR